MLGRAGLLNANSKKGEENEENGFGICRDQLDFCSYLHCVGRLEFGLILYLPLNSDATDESGYNNHGTEFGGISYGDSLIKGTAELDGVDDYIDIPYSSLIEPFVFTLSTWIKTSTKGTWQPIIDTNHNDDDCSHGYNLNVTEGGHIKFVLDKSSSCGTSNNHVYSDILVNDGEWHHIVAGYDYDNGKVLSLYVDGIFQDSATNGYAKTHRSIRIGMRRGGGSYFQGNIDDVRMYNRILTESEITELFEKHITSNAGSDQMVFDEINLDGSQSFDPNSEDDISSYQWQIVHRENSSFNATAEGIQPTIYDIQPGFYDVTLTVSDEVGSVHTDHMLFSAIGCKGDFDGDGNVDGSDLAEFAANFGRTDCPSCE